MGVTDDRIVQMVTIIAVSIILFVGSILLEANICLIIALLMWIFLAVFIGYIMYHPKGKQKV